MTQFKLHYFPRACSMVTLNALVEAKLDYQVNVVNIMTGEQKSPDYLKIHPGGKVPALQVGERVLTENAAILLYLDAIAPEAGLLPQSTDPLERAQSVSELIWCASSFHPAIRQVRMAMRFTDGDPSGVRAKGVEFSQAMFAQADARLSQGEWWFGDAWSIVDVYVNWCVMTAISAEPSLLAPCPSLQAHMQRVHARPSFQTAMQVSMQLEEDAGIVFLA
ncbi:MAG: glutathione S-transferase family protein [Pseudomonadota bacterium]